MTKEWRLSPSESLLCFGERQARPKHGQQHRGRSLSEHPCVPTVPQNNASSSASLWLTVTRRCSAVLPTLLSHTYWHRGSLPASSGYPSSQHAACSSHARLPAPSPSAAANTTLSNAGGSFPARFSLPPSLPPSSGWLCASSRTG